MNTILKVTFIDKESGGLSKLENLKFIYEDDNVDIENENIKKNGKELADNKNINIENVNKNVVKKHDNSFNKDIIKQEKSERSNTRNCTATNNSNKITSPMRQNDTLSYIKEFDLFLKQYKENYDACNTMEPLVNIVSETEEFTNDVNKHENLEQMFDYTNLFQNSKTATARSNVKTDEMIKKCIYTNETRKFSKVDNLSSSSANIVKPPHVLNTQNKFNSDDVVQNYNNDDENVGKNNDAIIEETKSVISTSSESNDLTIDIIRIDPSVNYSIFSLCKMENDNPDEFETYADCEGYNSSDFEFIDEQEACKGGIIHKFDSNSIQFENLNNRKIIDERKKNQPGPSKLGFTRPESGTPLGTFNSNTNSDSEIEGLNNNHIIPEGENLYELFAEPWAAFNYQVENKAFFSNKAMHLDVDNYGFNLEILHRRHPDNEVDDAVKQEAIENAQKIHKMYPIENTKRRRRF